MRTCGIKLTHDGGVAVTEDGRLSLSIEMEKLGNSPRYRNVGDLSEVFDLLSNEGLRPSDIDVYAVDGWRKTDKMPWQGQDVRVSLVPYRRGLYSDNTCFRGGDDTHFEEEQTAWRRVATCFA